METNTRNMEKASARREHFERGGTPSMWRGSAKTFTDKRKHDNRNKCRRRGQEGNEDISDR